MYNDDSFTCCQASVDINFDLKETITSIISGLTMDIQNYMR